MTRFKTTPLLCPRCKQNLTGTRYDRAFNCAPCGHSILIEQGEARRFPLIIAAATEKTAYPVVYLPFWRFDLKIEVACANKRQRQVWEKHRDLTVAWVTGFSASRVMYHGDLGMDLTERRARPLKTEVPVSVQLTGVTQTPREALSSAELFIMKIVDARVDITGMSFDIKPCNAELWALPFADAQDRNEIIDLNTGLSIPSHCIEDLYEIRKNAVVQGA